MRHLAIRENKRFSIAPHGFGKYDLLALVLVLYYAANGAYFLYLKPVKTMLVLDVAMLAVTILMWLVIRRHKDGSECLTNRVFPVVLVVNCMLYALFFTPFTAPDEDYHFYHSYAYANIVTPDPDDRFMIRLEDFEWVSKEDVFNRTMSANTWPAIAEDFTLFAKHAGMIRFQNKIPQISFASDPPQAKLASAVGICLARLLNLSGIALFYLGRITNLLFCAFLVIVAVRITPVGKNAMMATALLPMTTHLFGSYSYDGSLIGFTMLLTALLLKLSLSKEKASKRDLLLSVVLSILIAPYKLVYVVVVGLALFVPRSAFGSKRIMWCWKMAMLVLPVVSILIVSLAKIVSISGVGSAGGGQTATRDASVGVRYTLPYIMAHPLAVASKIMLTLRALAWSYASGMVGYMLGWFQPELTQTDSQTVALVFALIMATARSHDDSVVLTTKFRVACLVISLLAFAGFFTSMLLGFTFIDDVTVLGVQGRYFLPVLPCFLLGLKGRTLQINANVGPALMLSFGSFVWFFAAQMTLNLLCVC